MVRMVARDRAIPETTSRTSFLTKMDCWVPLYEVERQISELAAGRGQRFGLLVEGVASPGPLQLGRKRAASSTRRARRR